MCNEFIVSPEGGEKTAGQARDLARKLGNKPQRAFPGWRASKLGAVK